MATKFCFPVSCCNNSLSASQAETPPPQKKCDSKELSFVLFILCRISSISVLYLLQECKKDQELEGTDRQYILITVNLLCRWCWLDWSVTLHTQMLSLLLPFLEDKQIGDSNERCFFLRRQVFQSTVPALPPVIR